MTVQISPNIKKEKIRIDRFGNEIDPKTKQIIKPLEKEQVPKNIEEIMAKKGAITAEQAKQEITKNKGTFAEKLEKMIEKKIEEKIDSIINKMFE